MRIKDYLFGQHEELDQSAALRAELDAVTQRLSEQVSSVDRLLQTPPEQRFLIEDSIFPTETRQMRHGRHHPANRRQAHKGGRT